MAQIDLKFASIEIRDGFPSTTLGTPKVDKSGGYTIGDTTMVVDGITGTLAAGNTFTVGTGEDIYTVASVLNTTDGAVNNGAGYPTTTTTMTVDGFTGKVQNGQTFKLASHATVYTITAHTETTGNTTSITFTPGLADAALDNDVIDIQTPWTISVTFAPGLVATAADNDNVNVQPHSLTIKIGNGTMTYDEKRKIEYILDRGRLDTVRLGDEEPIDVRFDFVWDFLTAVTSSGIPTIEDALKKRGEASNWITSSPDTCEPYSVDILIKYEPECIGIDWEHILLQYFRWEGLNHDFKAGTVAVTGKCHTLNAIPTRVVPTS